MEKIVSSCHFDFNLRYCVRLGIVKIFAVFEPSNYVAIFFLSTCILNCGTFNRLYFYVFHVIREKIS